MGNQSFYYLGAGCRCTEPLIRHYFGKFFVVDKLARPFHSGEKSSFCIAGRRLCGFLFKFCPSKLCRFRLRNQRRQRGCVGIRLLIDVQPAGHAQNLSFGFKYMRPNDSRAHSDVILGFREECRYKAARYHIIYFLLVLVEFLSGYFGWNEGEVVADLLVVEYALAGFCHIIAVERNLRISGIRFSQHGQSIRHHIAIIFRKGARIRARICNHLMFFIESLRYAESSARRKRILVVGLALKRCQIIKPGSNLLRQGTFVGRLANTNRTHCVQHQLRIGMLPNAISLIQRILFGRLIIQTLIDAFVRTVSNVKFGHHFPIWARLETLYFPFARNNH